MTFILEIRKARDQSKRFIYSQIVKRDFIWETSSSIVVVVVVLTRLGPVRSCLLLYSRLTVCVLSSLSIFQNPFNFNCYWWCIKRNILSDAGAFAQLVLSNITMSSDNFYLSLVFDWFTFSDLLENRTCVFSVKFAEWYFRIWIVIFRRFLSIIGYK